MIYVCKNNSLLFQLKFNALNHISFLIRAQIRTLFHLLNIVLERAYELLIDLDQLLLTIGHPL